MKFYREDRVIASGRHVLEHIVIDANRGACWAQFGGTKKDGSEIRDKPLEGIQIELKAKRAAAKAPAAKKKSEQGGAVKNIRSLNRQTASWEEAISRRFLERSG